MVLMDRMSYLLFAVDVSLLATSLLGWLAAQCEVVGMRVSSSKFGTMILYRKMVDYFLRLGT